MGTGGISNGVSSDAAGNAYATGMVSNPGLFDNLVIPCNVSDVFLAKYDTAGNIQWANVGGGDLLDQGNEMVTDAAEIPMSSGAIQTNSLHPTAKFGNFILTGNGDNDWLVVKYDTAWQVVWAKNYGSTAGDFGDGVALDSAGNVYVTGFYSSTMTVQGVTVTSKGLFDVFLAKFDTNGTLLWLKSGGWYRCGSGPWRSERLARKHRNCGRVPEHSDIWLSLCQSGWPWRCLYRQYDAAGNNLWVHGGGSTTSFAIDPAKAIAVDGADNFFITGDYTGTATFDGLLCPQHRDEWH